MARLENNVMRYDAANPEDLRVLVENGAIWRAGPRAQQAAIEALVAGTLPMNDRVPPEVARFIKSQQSPEPASTGVTA